VLVAGISALLSAGLCVVGYYGVIGKGGEMRVKVGLLGMEVGISIVHCCVLEYGRQNRRYEECGSISAICCRRVLIASPWHSRYLHI